MAPSTQDQFSRGDLITKLRHLQIQVGLLSVESHGAMVNGEAGPIESAAPHFDPSDWAAIAAASDTLVSDLQMLITELDTR